MKRKIMALCLGVTLALGLAACGSKEEEREAAQKQEQASQDGQSESGAAADEQDENARPELKNHIEDLGQYDTVILGFPNWWADLPMPVYTFLEEYDLSGKTIIPFVTHGGSGFSDTKEAISELEPDAAVSDNTLSLSRGDIADSEEEIRQWAESLR